jgi:hypothetical protein
MFNNSTFDSESDSEPAVNNSARRLGETDLPLAFSAGSQDVDLSQLELNSQPSLELPSAPSSPAANAAQTFNSLEALHNLPRLQRYQLPLDLYNTMVSLVPSGEEESYLFRYMYIARLPPRLRMFAEGLHSLPNELLADVCDYLWGFWSDTDPAGPWFHRPTCRFARIAPARRGGLAREYNSRRPVLPTDRVPALPGGDPDCECWEL